MFGNVVLKCTMEKRQRQVIIWACREDFGFSFVHSNEKVEENKPAYKLNFTFGSSRPHIFKGTPHVKKNVFFRALPE